MDNENVNKAPITIKSGLDFEETKFIWKIENFDFIVSDSVINGQKFDFEAGQTLGLASKWTFYLKTANKNGEPWIGIYCRMKERPSANCTELFTQFEAIIIEEDEQEVWAETSEIQEIYCMEPGHKYGFPQMIPGVGHPNEPPSLVNDSLVIRIKFWIYSPVNLSPIETVETMLEKFHVKSAAKARSDLATLLEDPIACNDIQVISNDGKVFTAQKGCLAARNRVFRAMLESDMLEGNNGVIQLPDISSPALNVLLHFLYTGELIPDWTEPAVVVELTNAAAKYQIADLLEFLDEILGRVCVLKNVGALMTLANQLSLKTAEEGLLKFAKGDGTASTENFLQMLEGLSTDYQPLLKRAHEEGSNDESDSKRVKVNE